MKRERQEPLLHISRLHCLSQTFQKCICTVCTNIDCSPIYLAVWAFSLCMNFLLLCVCQLKPSPLLNKYFVTLRISCLHDICIASISTWVFPLKQQIRFYSDFAQIVCIILFIELKVLFQKNFKLLFKDILLLCNSGVT